VHRKKSTTLLLFAPLVFLSLFVFAGCGGGGDEQSKRQLQGEPHQQPSGETGKTGKKVVPARKIALGTVTAVDPKKKRIFLDQFKGRPMSFKVGKTTKIMFRRREVELSSVKKSQQAQGAYLVRNDLNRARAVHSFGGADGPIRNVEDEHPSVR
jgi:hypothetical protein